MGFNVCSLTSVLISLAVVFLATQISWKSFHFPDFFGRTQCFRRFATKTPYRANANADTSSIVPEGCEPIQIWMMNRHGTRNPSSTVIQQMRKELRFHAGHVWNNHLDKRGDLTDDQAKAILLWQTQVVETDEKKLTTEGESELRLLAERYKARLPHILGKPYDVSVYKFKYTSTQRAAASARSFAEGLFGKEESRSVYYPEPVKKDPVLRFYKNCPKWRAEVDKNPNATLERQLFEKQPEVRNMIAEVSARLGYTTTLTLLEVELMYLSCAFETAWNEYENEVPWCAAFTEDNLKILEYREDLEYYWIDGHGFPINYLQACPAIRDVMEHFRTKIQHPVQKLGAVLYFSHSGTVLKILARLGLFHDHIPLMHDGYHSQTQRLWRTSYIDCFASNIAFVLFKCGDKYKVMTFVQERPVIVSGCVTELCDFENFDSYYGKNIADVRNINELCRLDDCRVPFL